MQILHPFAGSVQQYCEQISDPDRYRPGHCPQCQAKRPLTAHGFYTRTLIDVAYDGILRVRRYLCQSCQRTVSLLPEFVLPYLRSSILFIALFLLARLLHTQTLTAAADSPLSSASRGAVRRAGHVGQAHSRAGLRQPGSAHARIPRLDRRAPLSVRQLALPPAGLAPRSGSRWPPSRIVPGRRAGLRLPTHHLSGTGTPSPLILWGGEKKPDG